MESDFCKKYGNWVGVIDVDGQRILVANKSRFRTMGNAHSAEEQRVAIEK